MVQVDKKTFVNLPIIIENNIEQQPTVSFNRLQNILITVNIFFK